MKLPILFSVPHGGLEIPEELVEYTLFDERLIWEDSDQGSVEIYHPLERYAAGFQSINFARCFIDMNRAPDDRSPGGVVKTHASWGHQLYDPFPPEALLQSVIARYHTPYHQRLSSLATNSGAKLGIDCHTMCEFAPKSAPDQEGSERPMICLSDLGGESISDEWMTRLVDCFTRAFHGFEVRRNSPFRGGYITRRNMTKIPSVQIEISRSRRISDEEKGLRVLEALVDFSSQTFGVDYSPILRKERRRRKLASIWNFLADLIAKLLGRKKA